MGVSSILVGRNTATYMIWDAMRAIDYVCTRDDIDSSRIGYTGCSGGGTLTSYVMSLDPRVTCAAPACYLTTFQKLIETRGPQDSEQNIFGQLAFGMDHPDYVIMRAPRPTLITSTTGDYFDIKGAWANYRQAKRVYGVLGYPHQVDMVEVEGTHGVKPQSLATIGYWMQRWLLDKDANVPIRDFDQNLQELSVLNCTEKGQVLSLENEKSVFDLNADIARQLSKNRRETNGNGSDEDLRKKISKLAGIRSPEKIPVPRMEDIARVHRDEYHIDKLVLHTDSKIPLPGLTFHPKIPQESAYLYLTDEGKTGDGEPQGPIEDLVNDGYAVVTLDMRGQGETSTAIRDDLLGDWKLFYLAYLQGQSLVGPRTEDAISGAKFIANYALPTDKKREVHLVGVGQAGIVALHAAAVHPNLFATVTIKNAPRSWTNIVGDQNAQGQLDSIVHGALQVYDLPDLVRLAGGSDKVKFETTKD
jgi:cephalosporin-C deacetylase-like acetyl esterase